MAQERCWQWLARRCFIQGVLLAASPLGLISQACPCSPHFPAAWCSRLIPLWEVSSAASVAQSLFLCRHEQSHHGHQLDQEKETWLSPANNIYLLYLCGLHTVEIKSNPSLCIQSCWFWGLSSAKCQLMIHPQVGFPKTAKPGLS